MRHVLIYDSPTVEGNAGLLCLYSSITVYFVGAVLQDKGRKICLGLIWRSVLNLHVEQAK